MTSFEWLKQDKIINRNNKLKFPGFFDSKKNNNFETDYLLMV